MQKTLTKTPIKVPNKAIEKAKAGIKKPIAKVKGKIKAKPTQAYIFGGLGLAVLGVGAYFGYRYYRKNKKEKSLGLTTSKSSTSRVSTTRTTSTSRNSSTPTFGFSCERNNVYPVKYGNCGDNVITLQKYLLHVKKQDIGSYGDNGDGVDGKFGPTTQRVAQSALGKTVFSETDINSYKNSLKLIGK